MILHLSCNSAIFGSSTGCRRRSASPRVPSKVSVLYGSNGAGKTAILNSFTWAMYDSVSKGFLFPDQIINKRAVREAAPGTTLEASVQLKFEHLGRTYVLKKTVQAIKGVDTEVVSKGEPLTTLMWADADGKWKSEIGTADAIGRVLPRDLHTYFFFDGERIERIVQPLATNRRISRTQPRNCWDSR